jgi:hypothetical protein
MKESEQSSQNLRQSSMLSGVDLEYLNLIRLNEDFLAKQPTLKQYSEAIEFISKNKNTQEVLCKICSERQSNLFNEPCLHASICHQCSDSWMQNNSCCPFCREEITKRVLFKLDLNENKIKVERVLE